MKEMFIAVLVVMALLLALLFWVIIRCTRKLNEKVRRDFLGHLNVYDEQVEARSRKLRNLEKEERKLKSRQKEHKSVPGGVQVEYVVLSGNPAEYKEENFGQNYALVQTQFKDTAYQRMQEKVQELCKTRRDLNVHEYREIQAIFTEEMQYEMMTLPPEYEREIIAMIAQNSIGKRRILESYSRLHEEFNFKGFMEYIEQYIFNHDSTVRVYSHTGEPCLLDAPRQVSFCADETIVEGYRVHFRDRVYDFSI